MSDAHDQIELQEWQQSLRDVLALSGPDQAKNILLALQAEAQKAGLSFEHPLNTPYLNTIAPHKQVPYPGSREIERRIKSIVRWNAMAMVTRANKQLDGIGGHISTYASAATLYEVGFNHFWHGASEQHPGDLVFFQGHASPGIYARAFVEGRLSEAKLNNFRRELAPGGGLSSYPHPWLMKDFWKFPTVSMGLGPLMAIYQARYMKYLENRGLIPKTNQKVWCFIGDGESDEPETTGCISIAGREKLDNLVFVLNCNLQRLDGPVRGNGSIVREMEARFRSANFNVVKCLWGSEWDPLLEKDQTGALVRRFEEMVDGQFQKLSVSDGAYVRENFFKGEELQKLVANMADQELKKLKRGGHDPAKVYNAYKKATESDGRPSIVIAKTVKGYGLGEAGEGKNIAHNQKKLNEDELLNFRTRFGIPISDEEVKNAPFYKPAEDSIEMEYIRERRAALGGHVPSRVSITKSIDLPPAKIYDEFYEGTGDREASTTMVVGRIVSKLLKDKGVGDLIVPIIPDESRTFGMESLFSQCGIYAPTGQLYTPVDRDQLMYYKEAKDGQLLQEGINEAGAGASWVAAGTAYSVYGVNTIPFYIFYSMFGFQRIGDLIWAAADSRCKGFLIGGTAGRTTLNGEGLQHEDGHSHVISSTVPNCKSYDPAYAYEMAAIIEEGIREMYSEGKDVFYYITAMNENYVMPPMPKGDKVKEGIIKGCYKFSGPAGKKKAQANLLGSGTILNEVIKGAEILRDQYKVETNVFSVTSYKTMTDDAWECDRWNLLHPDEEAKVPYVQELFADEPDLFVTSSDYMKTLPDTLARWIPGEMQSLGTNGFGRSESREALRDFFEVDHKYVVLATLTLLVKKGELKKDVLTKAIKDLGIDSEKLNPLQA
ncbi:pyruvate dehydrogenase (acetyl-transferring), homodimeric type [Kiritimatiellaeota bacterium B1221]|nr:pyruvate dehydrogenase (acetyl-transferring), homodimeric type [Kiritimatiellaeota bacterium B1221]